MLRYRIGQSGQVLVISDVVLRHFSHHRQVKVKQPEAGGQLFARLENKEIIIAAATGPRRTDRRGRTTYVPDRRAEQREIDAFHAKGLHYIGDWHTHPCDIPQPSGTDLASILDTATKSTHDLHGLLLIIVGTAPFPRGIRVSLYDGSDEVVLCPIDIEPAMSEKAERGRSLIEELIPKTWARALRRNRNPARERSDD